jgi:DNA repair protein SbcD/Mre11
MSEASTFARLEASAMGQPLRFVHAADLHLERPPAGLADVPDQLRSLLVDAPYRAAERMFDAAIKEHVDFVVLAGDVVDPLTCGPRGLVFLAEQFQRLAAQGIQVYWAGGPSDDFERWLGAWPLSDNVHRFAPHRVSRIVHTRGNEPLAQILGTSVQQSKKIAANDFQAARDGLFTVAVAHGATDAEPLTRQGIDYWALGGEHDRRTLVGGPITAHYCGTTQGRLPQESGPRGCTLAQVDESGHVRATFLATDAVRYENPQVAVDDATTNEQLSAILQDRLLEMAADPFGPDLLIHWTIVGSAAIESELRAGRLSTDLAARLRLENSNKRPLAWTASVLAERAGETRGDFVSEETVLGEFLRTVAHYADNPEAELNLEPYLAERHLAGILAGAATIAEPEERRRLLAEVAQLGLDLLGPREAQA